MGIEPNSATDTDALWKETFNLPITANLRLTSLGCPEGRPAVYTLVQCTPLLVEKAGVAPDMTLRFTTCKQASVQAREPPWL